MAAPGPNELDVDSPYWPFPQDVDKVPASHQVVVQSAFVRRHSSYLPDLPNVVLKPLPLPNLPEPGYYAMCRLCYGIARPEHPQLKGYRLQQIPSLPKSKLKELHEFTDLQDAFLPSSISALAEHLIRKHSSHKALPTHVGQAARTVLKLHTPGASLDDPDWNAASPSVKGDRRDPEDLPASLRGKLFKTFAEADVYLLTAVGLDGTTLCRGLEDYEGASNRATPIGALYNCKNRSDDGGDCWFGLALQSQWLKDSKRGPPYDMTIHCDTHTCRLKAKIEMPEPGWEDVRPQAGPSDTVTRPAHNRKALADRWSKQGGQPGKRRRVEPTTEEGTDNEDERVAPGPRAARIPAKDGPPKAPDPDRSAMRLDSLGLPANALRMLTAAGKQTYGDLLQAGLPIGQARLLFSALREYLERHPDPSEEDSRAEVNAIIAALALDVAMTAPQQPDVALASIRGFGPELLEFFALADMRTIGDLEQAGLPPCHARIFVREVHDYLATRPRLMKDQVAAELRYVLAAIKLS